ncbi:MAG: thiamine pyrophosphate-dependent enzyme, partial [Clostridia bacterium]|nr:thiamine pyrophosphate-dependent enzyme [Clostridia bacterium]
KELRLPVSGDIGCYTFGASAPLGAMDTAIGMGASIGMVHAFNKVRPETVANAVAAIGDSTFFHSGMTGLVDLVYNKGIGTVLILDNSTTGMTGHQPHPATGKTICGDIAPAVSIEAVCNAAGVSDVAVVDPLNMAELKAALKRALSSGAPSVIIARRPCALLKGVTHYPPVKVNTEKCMGCKACMQIGCPAVSMKDGHAVIDASLCVGCGLCEQKCRVGALEGGNKE